LGKLVPTLRFVGLTGGIGSGKSTVARALAARGIAVIDADQLARDVVAPGTPTHGAIAARWPDAIGGDGKVDRRKLGRIVFGDATARRALEALTHPAIAALAQERARELAARGCTLAVYEASLLVETGRHKELDGLVVVTAPAAVRIARVMERDHITEAEARARLTAQLPEEQKVAAATHVLVNDGSEEELSEKIDRLVEALQAEDAGALLTSS